MLFADWQRDYAAVFIAGLIQADPEHLDREYKKMEAKAVDELQSEDISPDQVMLYRSIDLRYKGCFHELNMQFPAGKLKQADLLLLNRAFKIAHKAEYGFSLDNTDAEIVSIRLTAAVNISGGIKNLSATAGASSGRRAAPPPRHLESRRIIFHGSSLNVPVYDRKSLVPFAAVRGPAVIEQSGATTLIWPGMSASADTYGNIIINVGVK
jgi:N-methylhydantoinase A